MGPAQALRAPLVLCASLVALALPPAGAEAATCQYFYSAGEPIWVGGGPSLWETTSDAEFDDAALAVGDFGRLDAFDGYGSFEVETSAYTNLDFDGCETRDRGRTLAYPTTVPVAGVEVTPQLYVDPKKPFGRLYVTIHNTAGVETALDLTFSNALGSDFDTVTARSSNGDLAFSANDRWGTTCEDDDGDGCKDTKGELIRDPELAHNWQGKGAEESAVTVGDPEDLGGDFDVHFDGVPIGAGRKVAVAAVVTLAKSIGRADDAADRIDDDPRGFGAFKGLSDSERRRLRNW